MIIRSVHNANNDQSIVQPGNLLHANPAMQNIDPKPEYFPISNLDIIKLDSHSVSQLRVPSSRALAFLDP